MKPTDDLNTCRGIRNMLIGNGVLYLLCYGAWMVWRAW